MSTLVRTWTTSLNNVATTASLNAQAQQIIRAMKDNYKAAGWTVDYSCDSVTAGTPADGVDRWDSDTDLVWAAGGVAHSWMVLKSPTNYPGTGKTIYLLIACSTGASSQHLVNVTIGSATFTSGSTTTDPTAPANNRAFTNKQFIRTPVVATKYHMMRNTVGDVINVVSTDGVGYPLHVNGSWQTSGAESADTYPWIGAWCFQDSTRGGFTVANMQNSTHSVTFWPTDNTVISSGGIGSIQAPSDVMSVFLAAGSSLTGTFPALPAILASQQSLKIALRGTLVDVMLAPTGVVGLQGTVEPASGSSTTAIFGDFWIPNGNVTPSF